MWNYELSPFFYIFHQIIPFRNLKELKGYDNDKFDYNLENIKG